MSVSRLQTDITIIWRSAQASRGRQHWLCPGPGRHLPSSTDMRPWLGIKMLYLVIDSFNCSSPLTVLDNKMTIAKIF